LSLADRSDGASETTQADPPCSCSLSRTQELTSFEIAGICSIEYFVPALEIVSLKKMYVCVVEKFCFFVAVQVKKM
jgi:hypothetical protein